MIHTALLRLVRWIVLVTLGVGSAASATADWVAATPARGSFALVVDGRAATLRHDPADAAVVGIAARNLAADVARVTGVTPALVTTEASGAREVLIGTIGHSAAIDALIAAKRIDVSTLAGRWESFLIANLGDVLVIVGSDRRGTAYGVYELSQAIGVSPWHWWADVTPTRVSALHVARGVRKFGPPSVKYRGIFLNDEDWGLQPWAARTFDPAYGDIGPRTYEKLFKLLLRLKANTLWPAMHKVSKPFNADPDNARLAERHAIVMGSSHAEPMLRNNVGEWKAPGADFNYVTNRDGVRGYWEERVRSNAGYESLWTLGMRGIHDSGIVGVSTVPEKVTLLERIFADQRALLAAHVDPDPARVPQMFMPYKEVLDVYRGGLKVPDDVTIIWPDDNFGYIRQFPEAAERARSGGSGVYYHLSYLGAPLSYLWLATTPPALVMEEMTKAWDLGAQQVWIANVGDLKPSEIGTSLFLEMAWDIERWRGAEQRAFLSDWAGRTFGARQAGAIGEVLDRHFRVNFERRPEHLQWWLPGQKARPSALSLHEVGDRMARFDANVAALDLVLPKIPPAQADAFYQLVEYPVRGAALANARFFANEAYGRAFERDRNEAAAAGARALAADAALTAMTRRYNEEIAGGKWRGMMAEEPADNQWTSFRTTLSILPAAGLVRTVAAGVSPAIAPAPTDRVVIEAEAMRAGGAGKRRWRLVRGLGRGDGAMVASPVNAAVGEARGPALEQRIDLGEGAWTLSVELLPAYAVAGTGGLRIGVAIDGGPVTIIEVARVTGDARWAAGVLDNLVAAKLPQTLPAGPHRLSIVMIDPGVTVDRLVLDRSPAG